MKSSKNSLIFKGSRSKTDITVITPGNKPSSAVMPDVYYRKNQTYIFICKRENNQTKFKEIDKPVHQTL